MITEIVILALLKLGPKHGYEIKKHIESVLRRKTGMNTNLLYPCLHKLEAQKAVAKQVREQKGRPTKHLYRITRKGEGLFQQLIEHFGEAEAAKDDEFLVRLAFFDFLDYNARLRILEARKRELALGLQHRQSIHSEYANVYDSPWVRQIAGFGEKQLAQEIVWLEELEKLAHADGRRAER